MNSSIFKKIILLLVLLLVITNCTKKENPENIFQGEVFIGSRYKTYTEGTAKYCINYYLSADLERFVEFRPDLEKAKCNLITGIGKCIYISNKENVNIVKNYLSNHPDIDRYHMKEKMKEVSNLEEICYSESCKEACILNKGIFKEINYWEKIINENPINLSGQDKYLFEQITKIISIISFLIIWFLIPAFVKENMLKKTKDEQLENNAPSNESEIITATQFIYKYNVYSYEVYKNIEDTVGRKDYNINLLLLRVFNSKSISKFLFYYFEHYWKRWGKTFTIVDPYLAKYDSSFSSGLIGGKLLIKLRIIVIVLEILVSIVGIDNMAINFIQTIFIYDSIYYYIGITSFVEILVLYYPSYIAMKMYVNFIFIKTEKDLSVAFNKMKGNSIRLFCYDNMWKSALAKTVSYVNVTMMDLRGFNQERRGCEYEINFLINHFSLNKVLFIFDETSDIPLFKDVVQKSFKILEKESPNNVKDEININIYMVAKGKEVIDSKEICKFMGNLYLK